MNGAELQCFFDCFLSFHRLSSYLLAYDPEHQAGEDLEKIRCTFSVYFFEKEPEGALTVDPGKIGSCWMEKVWEIRMAEYCATFELGWCCQLHIVWNVWFICQLGNGKEMNGNLAFSPNACFPLPFLLFVVKAAGKHLAFPQRRWWWWRSLVHWWFLDGDGDVQIRFENP